MSYNPETKRFEGYCAVFPDELTFPSKTITT